MVDVVDVTARLAHGLLSSYKEFHGQEVDPPYEELSEEKRNGLTNAVKAVLTNPNMTPEQEHNLWMEHMVQEGWQYGDQENSEAKTHPDIRPYGELDKVERYKDVLFVTLVKLVSYSQLMTDSINASTVPLGSDLEPPTKNPAESTVENT